MAGMLVALAFGPSFKAFGVTHFTDYEIPIIGPYAWLTTVPGFNSMRTPGRLMLTGACFFALAAGFGLERLIAARPRYRRVLPILATVALLLEMWPKPFLQTSLLPAPAFYRKLGEDKREYGVFDIPVTIRDDGFPEVYREYQYYQLYHHKGIAAGYFSRMYDPHPRLPQLFYLPTPDGFFVDGQPSDPLVNAEAELAQNGYRYLVLHKAHYRRLRQQGSPWFEATRRLVRALGAGPVAEDERVSAFEVKPAIVESLKPSLRPQHGWHPLEKGNTGRWAGAPATIVVAVPHSGNFRLELVPGLIYDPKSPRLMGRAGRLAVQAGSRTALTVPIASGERTIIPLVLEAGWTTVSLTLVAGTVLPSDHGLPDRRRLSFYVRSMDLITTEAAATNTPDGAPGAKAVKSPTRPPTHRGVVPQEVRAQ
jgi:hypothetical protein